MPSSTIPSVSMYAPNTGKRWLWCGMGDTTMTTPASSAATPRRATDHQSPVTSATDFLSSLLLSRTQAHDAEALRLDITLHAPRTSTLGVGGGLAGGSGLAAALAVSRPLHVAGDGHCNLAGDLVRHRERHDPGAVALHVIDDGFGILVLDEDQERRRIGRQLLAQRLEIRLGHGPPDMFPGNAADDGAADGPDQQTRRTADE